MKKILGLIVAAGFFSTAAWAAIDLDTIVVTGSRLEQQEYRVASNVTVITQDEIEASSANNLPDLLRYVGGVNIYDNGTSRTTTVDIRGFGDTAARNVLILINGRKVNSIDISAPDLTQLPLGAVERIEIIHGGASVLYGDNAVGGVINIITKKGEGNLQGKIGINHSSYNSFAEHLELSGSRGKNSKISYFLYTKYNDHHGYRENSDSLAKDFNTRLGYEFSKDYSSELEVGWHKDDTGLPGGLSGADMASLGRRSTTTPDDYSSTKDRYVKVNLKASPSVHGMYFGGLNVDVLYRNRDTFDSAHYFDSGNVLQSINTNRSIDTYGIDGKYVFDRTIFNKEVNFITGIDYYNHKNDILGSGVNFDDLTIKKQEFGVYEHLQYELLEDIFISTGTRYSRAEYEFHQRNIIVDEEKSPSKWVNSGGLKYEYAKGSNLHFSWQQTFRFLATDEWYSAFNGLNLDLKQQSGTQYEIGLKHNFNDVFVAGLTPYLMVNKNEIYFDPDPVDPANRNYDKTKRFGIEYNHKLDVLKVLNIGFLDGLDLITSYTYQNARFEKGPNDDKRVPMVPTHSASQTLSTDFMTHFNFSLTGRFVGSRYAINDVQNATSQIKPFQVLDTKLAYKAKNYEIYAAANNIFDMRYSEYVAKSAFSSNKSYFPAPERNFAVGMDVKF